MPTALQPAQGERRVSPALIIVIVAVLVWVLLLLWLRLSGQG
jgi:hypothetical protein